MATMKKTDDEMFALAKTQLRLPASSDNSAVPASYLNELKKHVTIFPDDTHFYLVRQRDSGFGIAICLENGCGQVRIPLSQCAGASDGGKKDGLGSLMEYRKHINEHPTHKSNRKARLEAFTPNLSRSNSNSSTAGTPANTSRPRLRLLSILDNDTLPRSPSTTVGAQYSTNSRTSPSVPVSSSQFTSTNTPGVHASVPRKRLSEGGLAGPEDDQSDDEGISLRSSSKRTPSKLASQTNAITVKTVRSPKKAKVEETKIPFALHDNNRSSRTPPAAGVSTSTAVSLIPSPAVIAATALAMPSMTAADATAKLKEATNGLKLWESYRATLLRKKRCTDKDRTSIKQAEERIAACARTKEQCEAVLRMVQPQRAIAGPPTGNSAYAQPQVGAASRVVVQHDSASLPSPTSALSHPQQITNNVPNTMKRQSSALGLSSNAPAASSSRVQLPPPASLQTQIAYDPMYQAIERFSGAEVRVDAHPLEGIALLTKDSDTDEPYDNNRDWYGRSRDSLRGPVAQAGELQQFFQEAGNAEQFDGNASVANALKKLDLPNQNTPFPGLDITLMPHQVIGVAWMLDKEKSVNKGGILGDEMGLGKTVQMVATMMANQSDDPAVKTTLIVAPLALLGQWKLEIELKTNDGLTVLIYHGPGKTKKKKELQKYDVVLTTFSTLALEWPDWEAEERRKRQEEKGKRKKKKDGFITSDSEEDDDRKKKRKMGLLITTLWYRVVLDEAQNIRNKRTRVSRAVTELNTTYRWCLTGTPITNGLGDAYPLLRFLQIRPWHDWDEFNGHIMKYERRGPNTATQRLQAIFVTCLLRRKKDTLLDGKRLIELPPKDVQLRILQFTPDERDIYKMVESRSQQVFNKYLRAGTVLKNYAHVLVMLLRLRQICSHTSLITEQDGFIIDDDLENTTEENRDELIQARTLLGREFVMKLRAKLKDVALERMAAEKESQDAATIENEECPVCYDFFDDAVVTPCMHFFCRECINAVLASPHVMDAEQLSMGERPCPACRAPICKEKLFSRQAFEPTEEELNVGEEPEFEKRPRAASSAFDEDEEMPDISSLLTSQGDKSKAKTKSKSKNKSKAKARAKPKRMQKKRRILDSDEEGEGDDVNVDEDEEGDECDNDHDDDLSDFIVQDGEDEEEKDARRALKKRLGKRCASSPVDYQASDDDSDIMIVDRKQPGGSLEDNGPIKVLSKMLPSTKMMAMMKSLTEWAEKHPDEKTMIISQWTQCLDLVSNYLVSKGFKHVRFQGNMSREKRDKAVRTFMKNNGARVLLMSLKCGGVGLNLTRANRVISLDLGWSEAVESQAFDRVHRLGQTRPVVVQRLVIGDTVEDRVLALQEKKKNLADGSLGEGNGQKIGRLSVRELANLFGLDHKGQRLSVGGP